MPDKRIKAPRLMSRDELAAHMRDYHGTTSTSRDAHNRAHHLSKSNHAHRSAKLSEPDHPSWLHKVW